MLFWILALFESCRIKYIKDGAPMLARTPMIAAVNKTKITDDIAALHGESFGNPKGLRRYLIGWQGGRKYDGIYQEDSLAPNGRGSL